MSEIIQIIQKLTESQIKLVGNPVQDLAENKKFYAFINVDRDKEGSQKPTNFQLSTISKYFESQNIFLSFVIVEDKREDVQASLKTTLFHLFPDTVRNVFVSPSEKNVVVWVEPKKSLTLQEQEIIVSKITDNLRVIEVGLHAVKFTSSENLPTPTACLNLIRLKAPLTQQSIQEELEKRHFHIPTKDWLSNLLDKLRKSGDIMRKKDGQYLMTLAGLQSLGTRKNKRSPDVSRALDIVKHGE